MQIPWIVWSKDVRPGFSVSEVVTTCDTAATALWLLGVPVPESFEAKPGMRAFAARGEQFAPQVQPSGRKTGLGL